MSRGPEMLGVATKGLIDCVAATQVTYAEEHDEAIDRAAKWATIVLALREVSL